MVKTIYFQNTYLYASSTISGPKEKEGPIGEFIDYSFPDEMAGKDSYEKGESKMIDQALSLTIQKARMAIDEIELIIGGDLTNQIASSNEAVRYYPISFVGVYGACSTAVLSLIVGSGFVSSCLSENALCFGASNYGSAERQFRYPLEYGVKKKITATTTATGAGCGLVSRKMSKVKIVSATLGRVIDAQWDDVNNMGSAMAYAAYDSITTHLKNTNTSLKDYDLIVTGDLSEVGSKVLIELFEDNGYNLVNYCDAGNLLYDKLKQKDVYCGGSGCACIAIAMYGLVVEKLCRNELKNVLLIGTGCLHSKITSSQKQTIPVIAHVINLKRSEE